MNGAPNMADDDDAGHLESSADLSGEKGYHETGIQDTAGEPATKEELRGAKEYAEMIVDTVREGLLVLDLDLRIMSANQSFYDQFDVTPEETVGRLVYELGSGQWDLEELRTLLEEILPQDKVFNDYEISHEFEGIGRRTMLLNARQVDDHELILLAIEDVTERRQAADQLRKSEAKFQLLYKHSPDAIVLLSSSGTILDVNPAAARMHDLPSEQITGRAMQRFVPERLRGDLFGKLRAVLAGDQQRAETRVLTANEGEEVPVEIRASKIDYEGHEDALLLHVRDVTERKKAEEELLTLNETLEERVEERTQEMRKQEERFQKLVKASAQIVWTTDPGGRVVEDSPSWRSFTGQSYDEWMGQGWTNALHPDDRDEALEKWHRSVENETPLHTEHRLYHDATGDWRWTSVRAVPLRGDEDNVRGWIGMNIDINERKRAERRVRQLVQALTEAEQEERRRIAAILHDDLQQQLYGAEMAARRARRTVTSNEEALGEETTATLVEMCHRMDDILGSAIETTRTLSSELNPSVLRNEDLTYTLWWLAEHVQERYDLTVKLDVEEAPIVGSQQLRTLLLRLVRELLFNVVKHAETNEAFLDARAEEGWLLVQVTDEGKGFDPDALKHSGGYGLSHMRERLHFLGGRLEVESEPNEGSRVTIALPNDFGKDA